MNLARAFESADPRRHDLKRFRCGKEEMDRFLARFAVKNMKLGLSRTWVLSRDPASVDSAKTPVAAYYTLAASSLTRDAVPTDRALPRYPVPVVLLARLAVDSGFQGQRLGEKTLVTALRHAVTLTERGLPAYGLILDVLDQDALGFYQQFEIFEPLTDEPMRLFVPMCRLEAI